MAETRTLPRELPLFPLGGTILLPGEILPLNVFEPRYLNMVDDVRRGHGHIGIIQTREGGSPDKPALARVGCAGRLDQFQETSDGRYLITLRGVSRFTLASEVETPTPYRVARTDYLAFEHDLDPRQAPEEGRERLIRLLEVWLETEGLSTDWDSLAQAPLPRMIDQLAMIAPFAGPERQRLLLANDCAERLEVMETILAARIAGSADGSMH
ncbi:LON peptidase substrate-binding domain-containing protein [Maricaulis sp.]|uniref:LON peptidase substrate-binding domain-containing protein n=1 Tax=Maricaulis sp. TaxID=1486257 RepID=UPI00260A8560|nr:LON peptidase substrate-binding domain-containing protein [Maricaulis sp.]